MSKLFLSEKQNVGDWFTTHLHEEGYPQKTAST